MPCNRPARPAPRALLAAVCLGTAGLALQAQDLPSGAFGNGGSLATPLPVPPGAQPLSPGQVDQTVNEIFGKARQITRFQAELVTYAYDTDAPDGPPRGAKEATRGLLRLATPNLMWIQDYGHDRNGLPRDKASRDPRESSYMIVDGQYYYDIQAVPDGSPRNRRPRGSRDRLSAGVSEGGAADILAVFAQFLGLDREVANASELRREYRVEGVETPVEWRRGARFNHLRLTPLAEDADYSIDLWHQPGAPLPERVKLLERKRVYQLGQGGGGAYLYRHTERQMNGLRTNLDGLPPFARGSFALPARMEIEWDS